MKIFQDRLRQTREKRGITQQDAAKELGIGYRSYRRYETGETTPDIQVAAKLADYFAVSLDYLAGRTERPELPPSVPMDRP